MSIQAFTIVNFFLQYLNVMTNSHPIWHQLTWVPILETCEGDAILRPCWEFFKDSEIRCNQRLELDFKFQSHFPHLHLFPSHFGLISNMEVWIEETKRCFKVVQLHMRWCVSDDDIDAGSAVSQPPIEFVSKCSHLRLPDSDVTHSCHLILMQNV